MRFFAAALIFFGVAASYAQTPEVPHKIRFAGMSLIIRDDAKREIQKDVDALTQRSRYFDMKVERAKTYFPIIEKIFEEENLPDDFKYLCLQESAMTPDAVSASNAVGFWQFKDFTAQSMGLRVDREVDERMNIVSSTRGAARYLKQNNVFFNNWLLALQSYQMGAGGVKRSVGDKYNGQDHMEITSETYWYVKKYLAHKVAFENICQGQPKLKITLYEASDKKLKDIAGEVLVDEDVLKDYNRWLKRGAVPADKRYSLVIPTGNIITDFNNLAMSSAKAGKAVPLAKAKHVVNKRIEVNGVAATQAGEGETIASLAAKFGLDVSMFIRYNDLAIEDKIIPGKFYFLRKKKKKNALPFYRTRLGDDLWSVSQQFGVQLKQLKKMNPGIGEALLVAGTSVRLNNKAIDEPSSVGLNASEVAELSKEAFAWAPQEKSLKPITMDTLKSKMKSVKIDSTIVSSTGKETSEFFYVVKNSDTLYGIARQFGATIKELMDWNNKTVLSVSAGEKLRILKK